MRHHAATLPLALLSLAISGQLYAQSTTSVQQLDTVSVNATRAARTRAALLDALGTSERDEIAAKLEAVLRHTLAPEVLAPAS